MGFFELFKRKDAPQSLPPLPDIGAPPEGAYPAGTEPGFPNQTMHDNPPYASSPSWDQHPSVSVYPSSQSQTPSYGQASFNPPAFGSQPVPSTAPAPQGPDAKDVQIIIAKLDAIRAQVESMDQRIMRIERLAETGKESERKYGWQ